MITNQTTLLMLVGGGGESAIELEVRRARQAAARDLVELLLEGECVSRVIVATDDSTWGQTLGDLPVTLDLDSPKETFHFGRRLAKLMSGHQVERALYAGGGAAPLMNVDQWRAALEGFSENERLLVTNNLHSSDWVAFHASEELLPLVARQKRDNGLAWELVERAGLCARSLPPTAASRFDLDTPADLLVARAYPSLGPALRSLLDQLDWPKEPVEGVLRTMSREGSHLTVIGRSSSAVWSALETNIRCWVRMIVEERGMIASGRLARGEVRSVLADLLDQVGVEGFFRTLAEMADAILMDNRVILGARGLWPSAADRFNADLLRWRRVKEPFLRSFARTAAESGIPILTGGQSVVSGGLLALLDTLTRRHSP